LAVDGLCRQPKIAANWQAIIIPCSLQIEKITGMPQGSKMRLRFEHNSPDYQSMGLTRETDGH
jgi:hypothetical protein